MEGSEQPFNGRVSSIRSDGKCVCKYHVGSGTYIRSLDRIKELSTFHHGDSEVEKSKEESDEEEVPIVSPLRQGRYPLAANTLKVSFGFRWMNSKSLKLHVPLLL